MQKNLSSQCPPAKLVDRCSSAFLSKALRSRLKMAGQSPCRVVELAHQYKLALLEWLEQCLEWPWPLPPRLRTRPRCLRGSQQQTKPAWLGKNNSKLRKLPEHNRKKHSRRNSWKPKIEKNQENEIDRNNCKYLNPRLKLRFRLLNRIKTACRIKRRLTNAKEIGVKSIPKI